MKVLLKIWRQDDRNASGELVDYPVDDVDPNMSFLDMLDMLNEQLVRNGDKLVVILGEHDEVLRAEQIVKEMLEVRSHIHPVHGHMYHEHPSHGAGNS